MSKNEFRLWDERVIFENGMYYYLDGSGRASLISKECAKKIEADYYCYQAGMDVNRGGMDPEIAYPGRGFSKDSNGNWKYTRSHEVEKLNGDKASLPLEGDFIIPASVNGRQKINYIRREAFLGCDLLSEITIPDTVQIIEEKAFCDTEFYKREKNWTEDALYLNGWLIKVREQAQGTFNVLEGTVGIANNAFSNCAKLTEINMPDSVVYIGSFAFKGCKELLNIKFPEKVSLFGDGVLLECPNLSRIQIPTGVKDMNAMLRSCANLVSIKIPEGVTKIGAYAFADCERLMNIELPDSLTQIASTAFQNTGYVNDKANWEDGVLYLGKWLLKANEFVCGIYTVKEGTVGIADYAFGDMLKCICPNLTGINMPETVRYIGDSAFGKCNKLAKVCIPNQVECIRSSLFRECAGLVEVRFGVNVKVMEKWVFYRNMNLESLVIDNPEIEIENAAIYNCPKLTIYAPEGSTAQRYAFQNGYGIASNLCY